MRAKHLVNSASHTDGQGGEDNDREREKVAAEEERAVADEERVAGTAIDNCHFSQVLVIHLAILPTEKL